MSFELYLMGGSWGPRTASLGSNTGSLQKLNRQVISVAFRWGTTVPSSPAICSGWPGPFPYGGLFRCQVIHEGASFKELERDMPTWLGKFEAVLHRTLGFPPGSTWRVGWATMGSSGCPSDVAIDEDVSVTAHYRKN